LFQQQRELLLKEEKQNDAKDPQIESNVTKRNNTIQFLSQSIDQRRCKLAFMKYMLLTVESIEGFPICVGQVDDLSSELLREISDWFRNDYPE